LLAAAAWALVAALAQIRIRRPSAPSSACLALTVLVGPKPGLEIAARPVRRRLFPQRRIAS
jgi:hypothetical protein